MVHESVVMSCKVVTRLIRPSSKAIDLTRSAVSTSAAGSVDLWDPLAGVTPKARESE